MVPLYFPIFGIWLLFSLLECKLQEERLYRNPRRGFLSTQLTAEIQELAKAACKVECLRDCLNTLQAKVKKDSTFEAVLEDLKKSPVNVQSECRRLSPDDLFYNECEASCDTGLPYKECARRCGTGELQKGWVCHAGCRNLDSTMKNHLGDCLAIESTRPKERDKQWIHRLEQGSSAPHCLDCPEDIKYCSGFCTEPVFDNDIPQLIQPPQITEENNPRSFDLVWNVAGENEICFDNPIIFVLQVRTYFGPEFDPMTANAWKTLTMTTIPGAKLSEPDVGWWYQYRIAAVSRCGSLGFSGSTTPPVHVTSPLPQAASAPRQLVDGVWRFQADGCVHVYIEWKCPATNVIPVTEYQISWSPEYSGSDKRAVLEDKMTTFLHIVPASQTHYILRNLKTNMTYRINVEAISSWGSKSFRSAPASHFITTPGLPKREAFHHRPDDYSSTRVPCNCDDVERRGKGSKPQILSNFRPLRFSQPPNGFLTIQFANDPGVSDGQFLKTVLTINEFSERYDAQFIEGKTRLPKLLTIQWKQQACIETASQISKTFMPLKPVDDVGSGYAKSTNSHFVVLEPAHDGRPVSSLSQSRLTRSGRVEISSLQLNCHYAIFVAPHKHKSGDAALQTQMPIGCLCTPACFDDQSLTWESHFSCSNQESEDLLPPTDLHSHLIPGTSPSSSSALFNVSWLQPTIMRNTRSLQTDAASKLNLSEMFYRVTWGPAMDKHLRSQTLQLMADPYPRLDPSEAQTKVIPSTITSFLLDSLQPDVVYIFKIQSIQLRSPKHPGSQQEDSFLEILRSSREAFLYVQTPRRSYELHSITSFGDARTKVEANILMYLSPIWMVFHLTSPR